MKNVDILPNQLVPIEIRLEVYEKAIELIEKDENFARLNDTDDNNGYSTCLLLPCILWDLNHYLDTAPNGQNYSFHTITQMFPEWTKDIVNFIILAETKKELNILRIKYLKQSVNNIKKELNK